MSNIEMVFDLNNVCRTCLATENLKSLFDEYSAKDAMLMLKICTSVECNENDGLPVQICSDCISELNRSYKFALKSRESDNELRNFIQARCSKHSFDRSSKVIDPLKNPELQKELGPQLDVIKNEIDIKIKTELDDSVIDSFENDRDVPPVLFEVIKIEAAEVADYIDESDQLHEHKPHFLELHNQSPRQPSVKQCNTCVYHTPQIHGEIEIDGSKTIKRIYSCTVCKNSFSQQMNVKQNEIYRNSTPPSLEKPFRCTVCNKSFGKKGILQIHMRTHTKEKPYSCPICDKAFSEKSNVTRHMWMHADEKPHVCIVCKKSFGQKVHLTNHYRIHTGEKPFACSICHKLFNQKKNLQAHKRTQHNLNIAK